ncbi:TPA: hypothetical protein N0F65_008505 [Lagenidium giganteum]|uniref:DDE-1 domain-containing protein n=1 Tax=Lagenidium giganteum TaxID=4803 RepID=A0AAV2Z2F1_9STRA|nr:TPA: hypothetical protein N0F65_008505 [Lagenidium giganteum]
MDETEFLTRPKSRLVVAVKGPPQLWSKTTTANFNLTVVASGSAVGWIAPPCFIVQGKTVPTEILNDMPDARIATTDSGFINEALFIQWLTWLNEAISDTIERPVYLLLDSCSSHIGEVVQKVATVRKVQMVQLPAKTTHLLQSFDVAFFWLSKGCYAAKFVSTIFTQAMCRNLMRLS